MRATRSRGLSGAIGIFEIGDVLVRPYRLQRCLAQQLLPANPAIEDLHNETRCEPGRGAKVGVLVGTCAVGLRPPPPSMRLLTSPISSSENPDPTRPT